jgi:anti-sigma factor RsiW
MNCPNDSTLRAYLDTELDPRERSELEDHLLSCAACQARRQDLSTVSLRVASRLASLALPASTAEANPHIALARFKAKLPVPHERRPFFVRIFARRWRFVWAVSLAAAVLLLSLMFPAARSFAQRLLATLRVERVQTVSLDFESLNTGASHQSLEALAKILSASAVVTTNEKDSSADSQSAATQAAGFPVRLLSARADTPSFEISGAHAFHMAVDRERVQDILDQAGRPELILPATLDGATVSVQVPRSATVTYGNCKSIRQTPDPSASTTAANPCLALIEAPSPIISVPSDLNLQQLVEIGLQLGGWSPVKAREYCQTVDWKSTLLLPIPRNVESYETVNISGVRGTLMRFPNSDRPSYALLWVDNGVIYGLIGWGHADSAVQLASSLQ